MVDMEGSRNHVLNLYEKEQVKVSIYDAIHGLYQVFVSHYIISKYIHFYCGRLDLEHFFYIHKMPNLEPDPNAVPDDYIEEVYAVEDYTSTDEGGLSFSRGDRVYVLLRNRFGYCTGWSCFVADFLYFYLKIILIP